MQWSSGAAGHLGPIREGMEGEERGWQGEKEDQIKETDGGEGTRESAGQSDKGRRR